MPKIFLSYRRGDSTAIAGRLYERLESKYGKGEVTNEIGYIQANADPQGVVRDQIERRSVLLVVIGRNWLNIAYRTGLRRLDDPNDLVRLQIEAAESLRRPIIVALVNGASQPSREMLPPTLGIMSSLDERQVVTFHDDATFNRDMRRLRSVLDIAIASASQFSGTKRKSGLDPDINRQNSLRNDARRNLVELHRPPFEGVVIDTLGEVNWILSGRIASAAAERKALADLTGAKLCNTDLTNATLEGAKFDGADLTGAILTSASLHDASFKGARMEGSDLVGAYAEGTDFSGANLSGARLTNAHLTGATFTGAKFPKANLAQADLTDANLQEAVLSEADATSANFTGASLEGADFSEAILEGAKLIGATAERACFVDAQLLRADLSSASLVNSNLKQADFTLAVLSRADLTKVDFDETDLSGAHLAGAKLDAEDDILKRIKFDQDSQLDQVAWNGIETRAATKGKSTTQRISIYRDVARVNRRISAVLRGIGMLNEASKYRLNEQTAQRKILFLRGKFGAWLFSWILNITAGYGEKLSRTVLSYLLVVAAFAYGYFSLSHSLPDPSSHLAWQDAILLSIHAFHGRGFIPSSLGLNDPLAIMASFEAIVGLFLELVFIAMFSRRFLGG